MKRLLLKAWMAHLKERFIYVLCLFYKRFHKIMPKKKYLFAGSLVLSLWKITQLTNLKDIFAVSLHSRLEIKFLVFNDSALEEIFSF